MTYCLSTGYKLNSHDLSGEYIIKKVIGRGASTIAYLADFKDATGRISERIIKEFYPSNLTIVRDNSGALLCAENDLQKYRQGISRFVASGDRQNTLRERTCLKNETPPLQKIFEANKTCYLEVTPFEGKTFDNIETFTLLERIKLCLTTAKLIKRYHDEGLLYLDIKPENIFVLTNSYGDIVTDMIELIDFDSVIKKEEVVFGNSLSFTKAWAAPEQITPHGFSKISEATDVYSLGELVFWCVFDRHSTTNEHRGFSKYPFDEVTAIEAKKHLSRTVVQKLLSELFHSTLRSSVRNRFESMNEVVFLLEKIASELDKKEYIVPYTVRPKAFFVGRDSELKQIDDALQEHDIVFVSGIAGIGKSELVKQYIFAHKSKYDNILYWTFEGDFDSMIAKNRTVSIGNFARLDEETDFQYAKRKLNKLQELLANQHNLLVIDNMDRLVDELPQQETWDLLKGLSGKILISTRNSESLYKSVEIRPLKKVKDLMHIFYEYFAFNEDENIYVEQIIESVNKHTLVVELLAHHTKATHTTPRDTLMKLQKNGISGLSTETVRLSKDGTVENKSVFSHMEKIFSMAALTDEQVLLLAMLSLMPVDGVNTVNFVSFYSIEDYNNLNWLIRHGWVYVECGENERISIHPTIASVTIEYVKSMPNFVESLYLKCGTAISRWDPKKLAESESVLYADSLAMSTTDRFLIRSRNSAIFIAKYVELYSKYGNAEQKNRHIDFAIEVLQGCLNENKYSAVLEQCYYLKAAIIYSLLQYEQARSICEKHLKFAKEVKDIYFIAKWCIMLSNIYNSENQNGLSLKYYFLCSYYAIKIDKDIRRKSPRFLESSNLIDNFDYDYIERMKNSFSINLMLHFANWSENQSSIELYCSKGTKTEISNLRRAKKWRELRAKDKALRNTGNSFEIVIDEARIAFLSCQYQEAENLLCELVDYCSKRGLAETSTMYRVHQFLAQIALRKEPCDYDEAISEFEYCLKISDKLEINNTYMVRLELGYVYILCDELEKAKKINNDLWQETRRLAPEVRKTYYADALRNMGCLYYLQGNHFVARNMLRRALQEYDKANAPYNLIGFGKARTYKHLSDLYFSNNLESNEGGIDMAINRMEIAIELYKSHVGLEHPETQSCLQRLEYLKSIE